MLNDRKLSHVQPPSHTDNGLRSNNLEVANSNNQASSKCVIGQDGESGGNKFSFGLGNPPAAKKTAKKSLFLKVSGLNEVKETIKELDATEKRAAEEPNPQMEFSSDEESKKEEP